MAIIGGKLNSMGPGKMYENASYPAWANAIGAFGTNYLNAKTAQKTEADKNTQAQQLAMIQTGLANGYLTPSKQGEAGAVQIGGMWWKQTTPSKDLELAKTLSALSSARKNSQTADYIDQHGFTPGPGPYNDPKLMPQYNTMSPAVDARSSISNLIAQLLAQQGQQQKAQSAMLQQATAEGQDLEDLKNEFDIPE